MKQTLLFLIFLITPICHAQISITISAAISLKEAIKEIQKEFETLYPKYQIRLNFASSGHLRQQIEAGAPVDVFASASIQHMNLLEKKGMLQKDSRFNFIGNSLALTTSKNSYIKKIAFDKLQDTQFRRIGLGSPLSVPAGYYAKEAFKNLGLWKKIQKKAIFTEHVRQVFSYILREEVNLGIIYYSDYHTHKKDLKLLDTISPKLHSPIKYPMGLINKDRSEFYKKWTSFIKGKSAQTIFKNHGFNNLHQSI